MNTEYVKARLNILDSIGMTVRTIESEKHAIDSITITTGCYDGGAIGIGQIYSPSCTVEMDEVDGIIPGTMVKIYLYLDGDWKDKGTFFVENRPMYSEGKMSLTMHGVLGQYSGVRFNYKKFYFIESQAPYLPVATISEVLGEMKRYLINVKNIDPNFGNLRIAGRLIFTKNEDTQTETGTWATIGEVLSYIAILYGGCFVEEDGGVWLRAPVYLSEGMATLDIENCESGYSYSHESYGFGLIKVPRGQQTSYFIDPKEDVITSTFPNYVGTDRTRVYGYKEQPTKEYIPLYSGISESNDDTDIVYDVQLDNYLIGTLDTYPIEIFVKERGGSHEAYHTGRFSFPGYDENIKAGWRLSININEKSQGINFIVGEKTIKWDGGITTEISCNCNVDTATGSSTFSAASPSTSAQNAAGALAQYNNSIYADVLLANVANISEAFVGKLTSDEVFTEKLTADEGFIGKLTSNEAFIGSLTSNEAFISDLQAEVITTDAIKAATAEVGYLTADEADISYAKIDLANIKDGTITNAMIHNAQIGYEKVNTSFINDLTADHAFVESLRAQVASFGYLDADKADLKYADINFANIDTANIDVAQVANLFAQVGLIDRATIASGKITGFLDAVQVNAANITAGTLDAGVIDVTNLKASNITVGQINGYQIAPGAIDMDNLAESISGEISSASENARTALDEAMKAFDESQVASTAAGTAQATADGKNTVFYNASAPDGAHRVNDVWFDTDNSNKMYSWTGTEWSPKKFGTNAIEELSITNALIANATIEGAKIASLDAGKITTGTLSADRIGANAITANKIAISDFTNYATVNENFPETSIPTSTWGGTSVSGGYIVKPVPSNQYLMFCDYTMCGMKAEEQIYYEMKIKGGASGNVLLTVWYYDSSGKGVGRSYVNVAVGTTESVISGTIQVPSVADSASYFLVGIDDNRTPRNQIYVREVKFIRKNSGNLIVDGAITADKIHTGAVMADKIHAGAVTADKIHAGAVTAGKIAAGAVTASAIEVGAVTASKIAIGDFTNYATVSEKNENTMISTTQVIDGYVAKKSATDVNLIFCDYSENSFRQYDQIYFEFTAKTSVRRSINVGCWMYDKNKVYLGGNAASTTITIEAAETRYTGTLVLSGSTTNKGAYFLLGLYDKSPSQIFAKDIIFRRKSAGNLIVDGTITGSKIVAKSLTATEIDVSSIFAQDVTASGTIRGAKLKGASAEITNGKIGIFDITQYGLTFDNGSNMATLDRAGLSVGVSYGANLASGNYSVYAGNGIKCEYRTVGDTVFTIDSDAVSLTGVLAPSVNGGGGLGGSVLQFGYVYTKEVRSGSGDLKIKAAGNAVLSQQGLYLNDGVHDRLVLAAYDDGDGSSGNWGSELVIGAGGNTFIGGGESSANLRSTLQSGNLKGEVYGKTGEELYISSDSNIFFLAGCNIVGDRNGMRYDTGGNLYPLVNETGFLGTSVHKWNTVYAKSVRGTTIYENGSSLSSQYVSRSVTSGTITISNTISASNWGSYLYKQGMVVTLVLNITWTFSGNTELTIASIPSGFRPRNQVFMNVTSNGPAYKLGYLVIETNGTVQYIITDTGRAEGIRCTVSYMTS